MQLTIVSSISIPFEYSNDDSRIFSGLQSFLSINMDTNEVNDPNIQIQLGSAEEKIEVYVSTTDNKLYLANFKYKESQTYRTDEELTLLDPIKPGLKGIFAEDNLVINSNIIPQFPFVQILDLDINFYYKGMLGLGYNFPKEGNNNEDTKYSFLYQLKKAKLIDKYIISVSQESQNRVLYIGEYPNNFPLKLTQFNYKTCPLLEKGINGNPNRHWQCNLISIFYDYTVYKVNKPISFSLGGNTMNTSKEFFEVIVNKYFKSEIERNNCFIDNKGNNLNCNNYENIDLQELSFVFGKWSIKMTKDQLFSKDKNTFLFKIRHQESNFPSEWTFPLNVFANSRYQPVFDGEKNVFGMILN